MVDQFREIIRQELHPPRQQVTSLQQQAENNNFTGLLLFVIVASINELYNRVSLLETQVAGLVGMNFFKFLLVLRHLSVFGCFFAYKFF